MWNMNYALVVHMMFRKQAIIIRWLFITLNKLKINEFPTPNMHTYIHEDNIYSRQQKCNIALSIP